MFKTSGSADVTQREERRRSNSSAREGGANSKTQKLFCQVGRRRRPNREADFSASVPASQKKHERSEYIDLNWPLGQRGREAVFVRLPPSAFMQRCNFSLHNFVYPEKQGRGCGGFGINTKKLCKLKLSDAGRSEGSKVDKGGRGRLHSVVEFFRP